MAFGAICMTVVLLILSYIPMLGVGSIVDAFRDLLKNFPDMLMHYMLGFLLFAAASEVDLRNLGRILSTVLALSCISTLLSTFLVGVLTYLMMLNVAPMDFQWCLLFGAIVSPTDPVTVISILHNKPDLLPASMKYFLVGESLLNDAVGVVLYQVMLDIVRRPDIRAVEIVGLIFENVVVECVYGAAVGVFLAWLAYSAIVSVKDPLLEVVITFVLVANINMFCQILNASIPLAAVCAGLFIGNYAVTFAMHDETAETFHEMWTLTDETLNSVLFLMVGAADLFWNPQDLGWGRVVTLVVCVISISMIARFVAVALPLLAIIFIEWLTGRRLRHDSVRYRGGTIAVLTWAGMRGGISIALALGVPDSFVSHAVPGHMTYGQLIFFMTFILVVFSIVIQGMLFEPVIKMINRVSYEIMPSGGLGTYVSTMSLGNNGYNEQHPQHDQYDDEPTPEGSLIEPDAAWDAQPVLYDDYQANDPTDRTPLLSAVGQQPAYLAPDLQGAAPQVGVLHSTSLLDYDQAHVVDTNPHERQGSITFQNLGQLEKPQSITEFFQSIRSSGGIRGWFDSRARMSAADQSSSSGALRRSRTEPDNARLARGEGSALTRHQTTAVRTQMTPGMTLPSSQRPPRANDTGSGL